jgi:hypothetical protein
MDAIIVTGEAMKDMLEATLNTIEAKLATMGVN